MTQPKRNPLLSPLSQPRRLDAVARSEPVTLTTYYAPPRRTAIVLPGPPQYDARSDAEYDGHGHDRNGYGYEDDETRYERIGHELTGMGLDEHGYDPLLDVRDGDEEIPVLRSKSPAQASVPVAPSLIAPAVPVAPAPPVEPAEPAQRIERKPLVVIRRTLKKSKGGRK